MTAAAKTPPDRLYACRGCWRTRSGVEPTWIAGAPYRPTSYESRRVAECYFCGTPTRGDMFLYQPIP